MRAPACALALLSLLAFSPVAHAEEGDEEASALAEAEVVPVVGDQDDRALDAAVVDARVFSAVLRGLVERVELRLAGKIEERIEARQAATMGHVSEILFFVSGLGLLFLGAPLFLARRFPGRRGDLLKYGAIAGGTFFGAVNVFALVVLVLGAIQRETGKATNPEVAILDASLAALHENAEQVAAVGPDVMMPTLAALDPRGASGPLPVALTENIARHATGAKPFAGAFRAAASLVEGGAWIFSWLPAVLAILAAVLFINAMRPMLEDIVLLPMRARAGALWSPRRVLMEVLRRVGRQALVAFAIALIVIPVTEISGALLSIGIKPCIETFFAYLFSSTVYIESSGASGLLLFGALSACVVFAFMKVLVVVGATGLYLSKVQGILERKIHDSVPLAAHMRFWIWGTLALLWSLALPLAYAVTTDRLLTGPLQRLFLSGEEMHFTLFFVSGPLLLVIGFIAVFVLARGLRAFRFIASYRPELMEGAFDEMTEKRIVHPAVPVDGGLLRSL